MTVCVSDRAFAKLLFFLPLCLAGFKALTGPSLAIGVAIDEIANFNHTTVMDDHDVIGIDLVGRELFIRRTNLEKIAASSVAGGDVDKTGIIDRRGNHSRLTFSCGAPEHFTVFRSHADL